LTTAAAALSLKKGSWALGRFMLENGTNLRIIEPHFERWARDHDVCVRIYPDIL